METISKAARKEMLVAVRTRYEQSSKLEKGTICGEFTAVSGYHRKHAIWLLNPPTATRLKTVIEGERVYGEAVKVALILIWETADRICGKRLKAVIPHLMNAMEKHGHLALNPEVRKKLIAVSAATIDRMLTPVRKGAGVRRKRRLVKKMTKEIPIKTFAHWKDPLPGFLEIDFVVHGGGSMAGEYFHSLVATDVCSGWVEAVPLLAREQTLAIEGLRRIGNQLPVTIRGIDSDNDGAFINETLGSYCNEGKIIFTRSRPHHKNDQAWIEQKNGAVIRKMVSHERFSGIVAGQAVNAAARKCPSLQGRTVTPHSSFRHSTAMAMLQAGVAPEIIALWLGHESPATTHLYVEADISMKEKALSQIQSPSTRKIRFRPADTLLRFLDGL
jgi:hypothetical protein